MTSSDPISRTMTPIVMILCVIGGGLGPLLDWSTGGVNSQAPGFAIWYGGVFASVLLLLLLYEFMTASIQPRPIWQPLVTFFTAAALLLLFTHYGYELGRRWPSTPGPWVTLLATIGLLFAAALQVRRRLAR